MKTGVRYARLESTLKRDDLRWGNEFSSNGWVPDPNLPRYFHTSTCRKYLEIPIIGRYEFSHKKMSFYFELGISPHIFLETEVIKKSNLGTATVINSSTPTNDKRIVMGYVMGIGFNYDLSEKYQLFVQPTMRLYSSATSATLSPPKYQSFGLELGIRRGLSFSKRVK